MAAVVLAKRRADSSSAVAPDAPLFAANADGPDLEELLAEEEDRQPNNGTGLNRIRLIAWHTLEDPSSSAAARFISMAMMVVITISVFTFILGSEPVGGCDYDQSFLQANQTGLLLPDTPALGKVVIVDPDGDIWSSAGQRICPHSGGLRLGETSQLLVYLEATCVMIFTAELLLRLGSCTLVMPLSKFLLAPLNWVDLAAILPWYVAASTSLAEDDGEATDAKFLSVLRVLRLLRVLRVFKVGRNFSGMLLLLRTVVRSLPVVFILFMLVTICSLLFGTLIHMMESGEFHPADSTHVGLAGHVCADPSVPCGQMLRLDMAPTPFSSIPVSMYWCMVTMSTVGYGDLFPITPMGCVVGALTILAGMMTLALPITIISANFDEETREHNRRFELGRRRTAQLERLAQSYSKHEQRKAECSGTGEGGAHVEAAPMQQRSQRKWSWKGVSVAPAPLADPAAAGGAAAGGAVGMDSKKSSLGASGRNEMSCEKPHSRLGQIGYVTTQKRLPVTSRAVAQEQLKEEVRLAVPPKYSA